MLATENNDLHMMRWLMDEAGCDVNLNQPIFVGRDVCDVDNGGLNALWVCKSSEAMLELLSRGCNPNQSCQTEMNMGRFGTRQRSLMVGDGTSSCTVSGHEKLLIRHGANANTFQMSCEEEDDASAEAKCESNAYWPNLLQQENVDVEWCRELLESYGASSNWPLGAETNECGELPGFGPDILLQAVLDTKLDVVELLLQHNANVNLYELQGLHGKSSSYFFPSSDHPCGLFSVPASGGRRFLQCPLSAALKIGNKKMIELLKMYGAEADSPMDVTTDKEVQTLLQTMAMTITLDILVTMTEEPTTRCTRFILSICEQRKCKKKTNNKKPINNLKLIVCGTIRIVILYYIVLSSSFFPSRLHILLRCILMLVLPASLIFPSLHSIHVTDENQQDLIAFFKT